VITTTFYDGGFGTGLSKCGRNLQPATAEARSRRGIVAVGDMSAVGREWSLC
jgi:hypothetical protein